MSRRATDPNANADKHLAGDRRWPAWRFFTSGSSRRGSGH